MNIVFLDAFTLLNNELDITDLQNLGDVSIYDRTSPNQILDRCKNAEIVLVNKVKLGKQHFEQLPKLKYIGVTATGFNIIDIEEAKRFGILVSNVKNYSSLSVAQHTFALILAFANKIVEHNNAQEWSKKEDFCYYYSNLTELADKTLGLVGFGDISKAVAKIGLSFGMKIKVHRKTAKSESMEGIEFCSLEEVLHHSDYLSLHCPQTPETTELINTESLKLMKKNAVLINTARGGLINESALADALKLGVIAGAGLDVVSEEPIRQTNPLITAPNIIFSPHVAWASFEARKRLLSIVIQNILSYQNGTPQNIVN